MFHLLVLLTILSVSALVFVLVTGFSAPRKVSTLGGGEVGGQAGPTIGIDELDRRSEKLLSEHGITIESRSESAGGERTLVGTSGDPVIGGRYIAVCLEIPDGEEVPAARLLGFRDEVRAAGATRGLFVTGGAFPSDAAFLVDDAPISLLRLTADEHTPVIVDAAAVRGRTSHGL